ncbi:hypothetical protein [Meiothermus hypogaeus]|uniref:Uncharacterized protein n=2 Tax=Meiothermus hypogaeus TaxID=884155 RepID=A0A511R7C1_9DEIN|nr:hypothetical protein Mhypo_00702 [Meiothermus hypogaeus]GEM85107.1 hypothetical protein MHY01S_32730 [Meiothermus hypogaeus NBRC 106114]GIW37573.1 MAG: hypothetical protein KatS3mg073_1718 [Meiothermus sp.]
MDALALYRRGRYREALAQAQQRGELKPAALALLALGKVAEAQTILETWQPQESVAEAERLTLLGFAAFRRGDPLTYRRLALAAAQAAQTPLTLYHLAQKLPDDLTLWEALLARLPEQDPRYPAARSWVKRLSARYR